MLSPWSAFWYIASQRRSLAMWQIKSCVIAARENFIMNIEKRNKKMFDIISIVVLAAILLTAIGGILLQRQNLHSMGGGMRNGGAESLMQPESTQTSPTGNLVVTTGIILLLIGFGVIVLMLLVRSNWLHHNPA